MVFSSSFCFPFFSIIIIRNVIDEKIDSNKSNIIHVFLSFCVFFSFYGFSIFLGRRREVSSRKTTERDRKSVHMRCINQRHFLKYPIAINNNNRGEGGVENREKCSFLRLYRSTVENDERKKGQNTNGIELYQIKKQRRQVSDCACTHIVYVNT